MELTFYYNGELLKSTELHISAFDQAFLYGEGLYEPILVKNRNIILGDRHYDRLFKGASTLGINLKVTDKVLDKAIMTLLDLNSLDDAMVRIIVTKGDSSGYFYEDVHSFPNLIIITLPCKFFSEKLGFMGVTLKTSPWRDISSSSLFHDIRSLNAMHRRINYREAKEKGHFDALMINVEGYVTQCTGSNIFLIKEKTLITPDISCGVFPGVMREYTLYDIASDLKLETYEGFVLSSNVYEADECFITSTEAGLLPVVSCDGEKIGNGRPGRITKQIQEYFSKWYKQN